MGGLLTNCPNCRRTFKPALTTAELCSLPNPSLIYPTNNLALLEFNHSLAYTEMHGEKPQINDHDACCTSSMRYNTRLSRGILHNYHEVYCKTIMKHNA